jgi:hypothetical protein
MLAKPDLTGLTQRLTQRLDLGLRDGKRAVATLAYRQADAMLGGAREGAAMTDVSELLAKIETIVAQWRRKIWTDTQALGNIENAILKHHVANRVEHRKPGKP